MASPQALLANTKVREGIEVVKSHLLPKETWNGKKQAIVAAFIGEVAAAANTVKGRLNHSAPLVERATEFMGLKGDDINCLAKACLPKLSAVDNEDAFRALLYLAGIAIGLTLRQ